jgi:hypothetical protein
MTLAHFDMLTGDEPQETGTFADLMAFGQGRAPSG